MRITRWPLITSAAAPRQAYVAVLGDQPLDAADAIAGHSKHTLGPEGAPQISNGFTHGTIGPRRLQQKAAYVEPCVVVPALRPQCSYYRTSVVEGHNFATVFEDDRRAE